MFRQAIGIVCCLAGLPALAAAAQQITPSQIRELVGRVRPSLVAVQYTMDSEGGRREVIGQGIVVGEEGLVMCSMAIFPLSVPDEQIKEVKVIVPTDEEHKEYDADFLGRDDRTELAFVKTRQKQNWPAIRFEDVPVDVADTVISVGLLPRDAGYRAYFQEATVSARIRGPVPYVLVNPAGLTIVGSPVFNVEGKAIGYVANQQGQNPLLNPRRDALASLNPPPRFFVPASDFLISLLDPPRGEPTKVPWLGAALAGLTKDVAGYYGLGNVPAVQVGEVIAGSPADRAGLKPGDKILKLNGRPLDRGDEPGEVASILLRQIRRLKVGQKITLTVLRDKDAPPVEVPVILAEQPKQANLARRWYAEDLGMSMREVVFADTYARRLPPDTRGVVVAFVRPASAANSAGLRAGDLVTQLNREPVEGLDDFRQRYTEFRKSSPREPVVLMVMRDQRTEVIRIEPPQ